MILDKRERKLIL